MNLSVVATPIGNTKDITLRAKEVLIEAELVIAEDTRTTGKLLKLLGVSSEGKTFRSFHAQSSESALKKLLDECAHYEHVVLATDAGTPGISDPGCLFVDQFRAYYPDARIVPIPGPSALVAALSVSGFPASRFEFLGFIPHKKGRQTTFSSLSKMSHTVVFYESPHRILKTLVSLQEQIPTRRICIARELTKVFESVRVGTAQEHLEYYQKNNTECRGEFVVVIEPL